MIHQSIMNQICVHQNYDYCDAYGNIYYLAWSQADEAYKDKLEEYCIQDVMFRYINCFLSCMQIKMNVLKVKKTSMQ